MKRRELYKAVLGIIPSTAQSWSVVFQDKRRSEHEKTRLHASRVFLHSAGVLNMCLLRGQGGVFTETPTGGRKYLRNQGV